MLRASGVPFPKVRGGRAGRCFTLRKGGGVLGRAARGQGLIRVLGFGASLQAQGAVRMLRCSELSTTTVALDHLFLESTFFIAATTRATLHRAMTNTTKVLVFLFVATGTGYVFQDIDYRHSTVLKAPIRLTYFTHQRVVAAGDRYLTAMDGEINSSSPTGSLSLNTVDIQSLRPLKASSSATTMFADKGFTYTIHHGEDPYMMREAIRVE